MVNRLAKVSAGALIVCATVSVVALAQGARQASEPLPKQPTYLKDVRPILQGRCVGCHNLNGVGPFALTTYAGVYARRYEVANAVARRVMPPWPAARGFRKYKYDWSLTDRQIAVIRRWVARGSRKGNQKMARPAIPSDKRGALGRVDVRLAMRSAYTPRRAEEYRCFLLPWTPDKPVYITGFEMLPGQPSQVHHAQAFILDPVFSAGAAAADEADPGLGYTCEASQAPVTEQYPVQLIGGWAPGGGKGRNFPSGTGIRMRPGSHLLLQLHYQNHGGKFNPDLTKIALKLDSSARPSTWLAVLDAQWLLSKDRFQIPAGKKDVVYTLIGDPRQHLALTPGEVDLSRGFVVYSVFLHMHYLGTRGQIAFLRPDGPNEVLLRIRDWNFNWQLAYELQKPAVFRPGDRMLLECHWDNTAANQPVIHGVRRVPKLVTWGESSADEMCGGYLYASEPVGSN